MERMIVQHLHTDVSGKKPLPSDIMDGELAINYAANDETLFIKNSENAIVEFKDDKYYQKQLSEKTDKTLSLTYSELVSLRDNSQLIPGQQYRITDYTCTTTQVDTQSAGHVFDIIVTADDENTLNEVARAVKHEGDTYFANNDLNAWQIWYCLDNDTTRFSWADATNGKGVIYRMIDEFNNDVPYDFKNIQFKHPNDTTKYPYYYYTFASSNIEANTDYSLDISKNCHSNTIKEYINSEKRKLNCIIFVGQNCFCNSFGPNCYNNSSDWGYYNNIFGGGCYSNYFKDKCFNNIFGNTCFNNSFGEATNDNYLGNKCYGNSFGSFCIGNQFGNGCSNNSVNMGFQRNSFGNGCSNNSFGSFCAYNSFGQECCYIKFASDSSATNKYDFYQNNHFGDRCKYILFRHTTAMGPNNLIQNYNFAQGLQGTSSDYLCIDGSINKEYETKVEKNSNGVIRVFCLADIVLSEYVDDITPPTPNPPTPNPPTPNPPTPPTPPTPNPPTPTLPTT